MRVGQQADRDNSPLAAPQVAKSLPCHSMVFWHPRGARNNILYVIFYFLTTQVSILDLNLVAITTYVVTQCLQNIQCRDSPRTESKQGA